MTNYTPEHARQYVDGVDRSPTEVAALFLADDPDGDALRFLVEALRIDPRDAELAVELLTTPERVLEVTADDEDGRLDADADDASSSSTDGDDDEDDGELDKAALLERAAELGIEVSARWGAKRIAAALEAAKG